MSTSLPTRGQLREELGRRGQLTRRVDQLQGQVTHSPNLSMSITTSRMVHNYLTLNHHPTTTSSTT